MAAFNTCVEDTWEMDDNFCLATYVYARGLDREALRAQTKNDQAGKACAGECNRLHTHQLAFHAVERNTVDDTDARARVKTLEKEGFLFCIVGHRGWTQYRKGLAS
jgi:hypothetical protein